MAKRPYSRRRKKRIQKEEEHIRQQILAHAQSLAGEMNLRMLLWEDDAMWEKDVLFKDILAMAGERELWWRLCVPQRMLFVESVTVTDIVFPERRAGFFHRLGEILMRLFGWLRALLPMKSGNRPITNK